MEAPTVYFVDLSLSDVVLISEDKVYFHAHAGALCQSLVLRALLDSDLWAESNNKEASATLTCNVCT